ncbi:hypothetical protein [Microseira sp. BLCC-F43]|uniref:hypothetical protein n=1 Tax=Microseira sp. BLCC-F43 TaxID=3153602 RepID=UPI0035BA296C
MIDRSLPAICDPCAGLDTIISVSHFLGYFGDRPFVCETGGRSLLGYELVYGVIPPSVKHGVS